MNRKIIAQANELNRKLTDLEKTRTLIESSSTIVCYKLNSGHSYEIPDISLELRETIKTLVLAEYGRKIKALNDEIDAL